MALSRSEFWHEAQRAAAHEYGEKHANAINAWRTAPAVGVLLLIGAVGLAGRWAWIHGKAAFAGDGPNLSAGFWIAFVSLLFVTVVAYRPGRIPSFSPLRFVKHLAFALGWLALIAFTIGHAF